MEYNEIVRTPEEKRPYTRQQLLWIAIRGAMKYRDEHKATSDAAKDRLQDPNVSLSDEERMDLERNAFHFQKQSEKWQESIEEGFVWLDEWEKANDLPLTNGEEV